METIRHQSLVTWFIRLITVALYLEVGVSLVVVLMFVMTVGSPEDALLSAWPIEVSQSSYRQPLAVVSESVSDLETVINRGTIQFSSDRVGYYLLKFLDAVGMFALAIYITLLLKRIFLALRNQHPFTVANARRIRNIALLVIAIAPYSLVKSLLYRYYIQSHIALVDSTYATWSHYLSSSVPADQVWIAVDFNSQALLMGFVLLIIAEVFRVGVVIQADNESIV